MALQVKEFLGTTGSQYWTWKIRVIEENYIENNIVSTNKVRITLESYLGRTTVAGNSFFDGRATLNFSAGPQQSDPISFIGGSTVNAGAWHIMDSYSFVVDNTGTIDNPTQIQVSGSMSGAGFSPYNASASGTISLTPLHTPPEINNVSISEANSTLISLGVTNDTIVQYLSQKKFTIDTSFFDEANAKEYSVYHNNILIGTSSNNEVIIDFSDVSELMDSGLGYIGINVSVTDDLGGYTTRNFTFPVIKYTKPTIESTSTIIKRKTGNGTVLTDNIAILNFTGTCYKGDDIIGNANNPVVQYKIWNARESEPDYIKIDTPNEMNVSIQNYELENIIYTNVYDYKIKLYDLFTTSDININLKNGKVPTGRSVWSEYKDRVDFWNLTIKNNDPFSYSEDEVIIGTWIDGKPLYRKVITTTTTIDGNSVLSIDTSVSDADMIWIDRENSYLYNNNNTVSGGRICYPIPFNIAPGETSTYIGCRMNGTEIELLSNGGWNTLWTKVITINYTKTTD